MHDMPYQIDSMKQAIRIKELELEKLKQLEKENAELKDALSRANALIGSQANENDKIVNELKQQLAQAVTALNKIRHEIKARFPDDFPLNQNLRDIDSIADEALKETSEKRTSDT